MSLSPQDELLVRDFFERVASRDDLFPSTPSHAKQLRAICIDLLGYVVVNGSIIKQEQVEGHTYGTQTKAEDQWAEDTRALRESLDGSSSSKARTRKPSKNTKVREAVLPKDIPELEE